MKKKSKEQIAEERADKATLAAQIAYNKWYYHVMESTGVYMVTYHYKLSSFMLPAFYVEL